eukprot:3054460-Rhodomonas_salina.1
MPLAPVHLEMIMCGICHAAIPTPSSPSFLCPPALLSLALASRLLRAHSLASAARASRVAGAAP